MLAHDIGMMTSYRRTRLYRMATAVVDSCEFQPAGRPQAETGPQKWINFEVGKYQIRVARTLADLEAACRLRFKVFNVELGEGLASSYQTEMDQDEFDLFCDHLIVEDRVRNEVVGTYRMQSGVTAQKNLGYYSAREFDFTPYEAIRSQILELGRASIDQDHRTSEVLTLLWRGIAQYAQLKGLRYLVGCSSVNSQEALTGWTIYQQLSDFLVSPEFRTQPVSGYTLPADTTGVPCEAKTPKLLKTYIGVGARICGAPALDREFGTIDFLTLLDLTQLTPAARQRFCIETQ